MAWHSTDKPRGTGAYGRKCEEEGMRDEGEKNKGGAGPRWGNTERAVESSESVVTGPQFIVESCFHLGVFLRHPRSQGGRRACGLPWNSRGDTH